MTKRPRNLHAWKTRADDGRKREVQARLFGSKWTLRSRYADEEDWTIDEPPVLEDLHELHRILFNKYQRKHAAWEHVVGVKKLIEDRS